MIRRPPRSPLDRSSAASDVYKRQALLGVFPFVVMFIVTSIATLRERTSGTLERLLAGPLGKADLMFGYAIAFGLVAVSYTHLRAHETVLALVCRLQLEKKKKPVSYNHLPTVQPATTKLSLHR